MGEYSRTDQLRIIDANANRAREGIRTSEDYIRFGLGDVAWARRLKSIRGSITQILRGLFSDNDLVGSRNSRSDPGRPENSPLSSPQPNGIVNPVEPVEADRAIAHRGLKRAQEAIRVLEEYLRSAHPAASAEMASHRFSLYEVEQWLVGANETARILAASSVYILLTESLCKQDVFLTAAAVLRGGGRVLQLREKDGTDQAFLKKARGLRELCQSFGAVLICNDRVDLALSASLPGVHLGQGDLSPCEARRICGEKMLVGRSTHSVEQAKYAVEIEKSDYIAIGSMYDTNTKQGRILVGLKLAEQVAALQLKVPVFAIGGITEERVPELRGAGVDRIAVSTAIIRHPDPEEATRRLIAAMNN